MNNYESISTYEVGVYDSETKQIVAVFCCESEELTRVALVALQPLFPPSHTLNGWKNEDNDTAGQGHLFAFGYGTKGT